LHTQVRHPAGPQTVAFVERRGVLYRLCCFVGINRDTLRPAVSCVPIVWRKGSTGSLVKHTAQCLQRCVRNFRAGTCRFQRSLTAVYNLRNHCVSGLCQSSGILKAKKTQRFGNWISCRPLVGFRNLFSGFLNNGRWTKSSHWAILSVRCVVESEQRFINCPDYFTFYNIRARYKVETIDIIILYICILSHIAISLSLSLFISVFCAACQCFETLFSVLNTCHF
jgi:hypothetical protein